MKIELTQTERGILLDAVSTWGPDAQEKMLLEEMSELQKEICKAWRGKDSRVEIAEEIADVEIMLAQVKMIFNIENTVGEFRCAKLERIMGRLAVENRETKGGTES